MTGTYHGKGWYKTWQRWYIQLAVVNDDLAMKKKLRYGTILVDSLTHQVIDLIDSIETEAVS